MKNKKNMFVILLVLVFISCTNNTIKENSTLEKEEINRSVEFIKNTEDSNEFKKYFGGYEDPWENFNRRMYYFNYNMDKYAILPIVNTYRYITPVFIQGRITNFFRNIKGINTTVNSLAQMKGRKAMKSIARFLINTVFGLGGTFDVASKMGMPKTYEDFGLTLAHYGVPRGPYIILPFLGPSYLRDVFGMGIEVITINRIDPYRYMQLFDTNSEAGIILKGIDKKNNIKFQYYGTNSPFEYEYLKFLWSKYRKLQEERGVQMF